MQPPGPSESGSGESTGFLLRWRGKTSGPFTAAQIEDKLRRREIGLLHEVCCGGQWIRMRDYQSSPGYAQSYPPPATPALPSRADSPHGANQSAAGPTEDGLCLRWRGKTQGPFSMAEIERQLDHQQIGMLHEVSVGGRWMTLSDYFVQRNMVVANSRVTPLPAARARISPGARAGARAGARIGLQEVSRQLPNGTRILDEISLVIEPNEFVALLGPSGSGKSTLMNAMTGRRRASSGRISLNAEDFYANSGKYRQRIGHVPQMDIVHFALSVQQELTYSARLRLPPATPKEAISQRVSDVVNQIGLQERLNTRISNLSGGQLKRVSLGVELLSDPELLFLDEATSGLDAGTEARMMSLFRGLADSGRTVVCITHNLENVCLCDLVILLMAGKLVYYGSPSDLLTHFGLEKLSQVYDHLETKPADDWAQLYRTSEYYKKYVAARQNPAPGEIASSAPADVSRDAGATPKPIGALRQFLVLTQRYFTITVQDRKNAILLLAQAPIIALLLGLVFRNENFDDAVKGPLSQKMLGFLLVVSAIWFGCINAAREIVKELPIYLRERAINLHLGSYLASKVAILSLLCTIQCAALLLITLAMTRLKPDLGIQAGCLLVTAFCGMLMGLLVSSLVQNEDKAMAVVPILLIPQVIFSGAILQLSGLAEGIAKWIVVSYWAFDGMLHALPGNKSPLLKPHYSLGEDAVTISAFLLAFTLLAAFALKRKDLLK